MVWNSIIKNDGGKENLKKALADRGAFFVFWGSVFARGGVFFRGGLPPEKHPPYSHSSFVVVGLLNDACLEKIHENI
jgi:hypothetical protein